MLNTRFRRAIALATSALLTSGIAVRHASAQTRAPAHPAQDSAATRTVLERDIGPYTNPDLRLTVRELTVPPGARGSSHRHPGIVVVYVLAGSVEVTLENAPPRLYRAGEAFSELPGQLHVATRNPSASEPARLLSVIAGRRGEPLTRPERKP
jgi:quercetin dioxygenase-like cupin family protein